MSRVTLKDLSRMTNLSVNTISRALNDKDGVSAETKEYIKKLAEEHSYRPDMMAKSMRGSQNNLIGTIVGDITDNFFVELLSGVEEVAVKESMAIIIGNTGENIIRQKENIDLLLSYSCKNIIITPVDSNMDFIKALKEENINFVLADRSIDEAVDCNQVAINNYRDSFRAVEYLIQCGHRKIGIINQKSAIKTETDRYLGYIDALKKYNLDTNETFILHPEGKGETGRLMNGLLSQADRPTALFIAKDVLALDAVTAIFNFGLKIPEDLSVILYGNPEWSQRLKPAFTCMERPVKDLGRTSARIVIDRISRKDITDAINIVLDSNLVIRDSVRMM